jgi:hypothetical protein
MMLILVLVLEELGILLLERVHELKKYKHWILNHLHKLLVLMLEELGQLKEQISVHQYLSLEMNSLISSC